MPAPLNRIAPVLDRLAERIERAEGLDATVGKLSALGRFLKPGAVKDLLSGTPLGHPAHPLLVAVPIGSWVTAGYLDATGGPGARDAARRAVGLGLLGAAPSVATGFSDWLETNSAEARVGLVHAGVNDLGIALYAGSWFARGRDRHTLGVVLAAVGAAVISVGGWLGGHLAYAQGVGVDTTAFQGGPSDWADVGPLADVPEGEPVGATVEGTPLLLVRRGGVVHAIADRCTHRGAPLHEGPLRDGCIVCPWHESMFDVTDGHVVQGPATRPQPVYEVRVQDDVVQVRRPDEVRALRNNPVGV